MKCFNAHMKDKLVFSYEITLACNLRCEYCYVHDLLDNSLKSNPDVSKLVVEKIKEYKELYPNRPFELDLLGGDPLVAGNIWEFLDEVLQLDIDVWIVTNLMMGKKVLTKAKEYLKKYPRLGIAATWHTAIKDEKFKENLLFFKDAIRPYWSRSDETYYENFITSFVLFNENDDMYKKAKWCKENDIGYGFTQLYEDQMQYRAQRIDEWTEETKWVWRNAYDYHATRYEWDGVPITLEEYERDELYQISYHYNVVCHPLNWHITFNGEVYNSCNYEPRKRYNIKEGIQPMRLYCRDMDCKCSAHGYKETYGKRSK